MPDIISDSSCLIALDNIGMLFILMDDLKARKVAKKLKLNFTGLFGVILKAKQKGIIGSVRDVLRELKSVKFRISEQMEEEILRLAAEV